MFGKRIALIAVFAIAIIGMVNLVGCSAGGTPSDIGGTNSEFSESEPPKTEESEEIICMVTFDSDGGTEVKGEQVKKGEKINEPDEPKKDIRDGEYTFLGWYYGDKKWNFESDVVSSNMTLTAKWKKSGGYTKPF